MSGGVVLGVVRQVHLWSGLVVGAFIALIGLSGAFLEFYPQIDAASHPVLRSAESEHRLSPYEAFYVAVRRARPDRPMGWRFEIPDRVGAIQARSLSAADIAGPQFAPVILWLDPKSAQVLREDVWGQYPGTWIYDLHYHLLLGGTGALVVGVLGIVVLIMLGTGLLLWWPVSKAAWRTAFALRGGHDPIRRLYDWHKLVGIVGVVFLAMITATGAALDLPDQTGSMLGAIWGPGATSEPLHSVRDERMPRISLDAAVAAGDSRFPRGTLKWIYTPENAQGVYVLKYRLPHEVAGRFPNSTVWIDQYTGRVLGARDARYDPPAAAIVDWLFPLHTGEVMKLPGRILWVGFGFLPVILWVTGLWRWLLRRSRRSPRPAGRASALSS